VFFQSLSQDYPFISFETVGFCSNAPAGPLWRKVSFGTRSERGSRFVASMLTVLTSCQQQGRHALTYLTVCCQAFYANRAIPSLVP